MYGQEYEVVAHTFLDSHKAEQDNNHWILCTADPAADGRVLLKVPQSTANNQEFTNTNEDIQTAQVWRIKIAYFSWITEVPFK